MRGLVQFIADLRNARARELEEKRVNKELANIRQKFKGGSLNGYQKKKYVCKLLYVYIQGYDVDFGHLEAVNLISSSKYSEKQIGYLAVTLFLHEQHELLHLVVNSIRKDLLDYNELNNCLALHAVANVGGREMGEALATDVHRLLISPYELPSTLSRTSNANYLQHIESLCKKESRPHAPTTVPQIPRHCAKRMGRTYHLHNG